MADEPKKNEGTFCCKCLWTGTLSFTPEEMAELEGEIRRYMGPCPECGKNSLQLAQDPRDGHAYSDPATDDLFEMMEAAADPAGDKEDLDV